MLANKRNLPEQHSQNTSKKRLKTGNEEVFSVIEIKPATVLNNSISSEKFRHKVPGRGKTPSVACFFKKNKTVLQKSSNKKIYEQIRGNNVQCSNYYTNFSNGLSEISCLKYVDRNESINKELIRKTFHNDDCHKKMVLQVDCSSECNSLHDMNRWFHSNHYDSIKNNQTCSNVSYYSNNERTIFDEVNFRNGCKFSFEDPTEIDCRCLRANDEIESDIYSYEIENSSSDLSQESIHPSDSGKKVIKRDAQILEPKSKENICSSLEHFEIFSSLDLNQNNVYIRKTSDLPIIQDQSSLFKDLSGPKEECSVTNKEQISIENMKSHFNFNDSSRNWNSETTEIKESQDFHSMYSNLFKKFRKLSPPFIFPIEKETYQSTPLNTQKFSKCIEELSDTSLNHLISKKIMTKLSSFEYFIENFTNEGDEEISLTNDGSITFTNSFSPTLRGESNVEENNLFGENFNDQTMSNSESKNEMKMNAKVEINEDELNISSGKTQSQIIYHKNTSNAGKVDDLKIQNEPIKKSQRCSVKKNVSNVAKISSKKHLESCKNIILRSKTNEFINKKNEMGNTSITDFVGIFSTKSCNLDIVEKNKSGLSSRPNIKRNEDNLYDKKKCFKVSVKLRNTSNQNVRPNWLNCNNKSDKYDEEQSKTDTAKIVLRSTHQNEEKSNLYSITQSQREPLISSLQEICSMEPYEYLIHNPIYFVKQFPERVSSENTNEDERSNMKFSTIANSRIFSNFENTNRKCDNFFGKSLNRLITNESHRFNSILINGTEEDIPFTDNSTIGKEDRSSNISKRGIIQQETASSTQKKQVPEANNFYVYPEDSIFCKKSAEHLKDISMPHHNSPNIHIHEEKKHVEKKLGEIISTAHKNIPHFPESCDPVDSRSVNTESTPVNHLFSEYEYNLLKKTSSPLLADVECRIYLKSLIDKEINDKTLHPIESNVSEINIFNRKDHNQDVYPYSVIDDKLPINISKDLESKKDIDNSLHLYADSQEKEFLQFWENISSQNQHEDVNHAPNIAGVVACDEVLCGERSIFTQASDTIIEKTSQESRSDVLNHILSQNFTDSDSKLNRILKNMNSLCQKSMKQRNLMHCYNQNSNRLLELAFRMYEKMSTKVILSNSQKVPFPRSTRNKVEVEKKEDVKTYKLKENSNEDFEELTIVRLEHDSHCSVSENNHRVSDTNNREADEKILKGLTRILLDETFLYRKEDGFFQSGQNKIATIVKIKYIFENVLEDFAANKSPQLTIRRQTFEDCFINRERLMLKSQENPKMIKIHYKNVLSQPKFCMIMYVLAKCLELLNNNSKITKREMYYQIKTLVSNQDKVNSAIKAVSCMLSVGPWDLNIIAHKGMVFGDLKITMTSNEIINCNIPGTLIPNDVEDIMELKSSAYFILVVEKESIYYKLLEEDLPNRLIKPFIMITGKGFPDLNTQLFLRKLWMVMSLPVFILTDADPHGVNIMITYRFGSLANVHISHQLSVPKAKWLGVFPSEIMKFGAEKQPLTENEKHVIKNILKTPYMADNPKIEAELKILLESGHKAGIEGIMKNNTFLSEFYFPMKFYNLDLI